MWRPSSFLFPIVVAAHITAVLSLIALYIVMLYDPAYRIVDLFEDWYPQLGTIFGRIRDESCSAEHNTYLTATNVKSLDEIIAEGGTPINRFVQPLILCILTNANEYVKADVATAQVLLGLMPSILAIVSPSAEEFATLSNIGGRRVFTYLLVVASPVFFINRAFDLPDPNEVLRPQPRGSMGLGLPRPVVAIGQCLLLIACLVNTLLNCYRLGLRTSNPVSPMYPFFMLIWAGAAPGIHLITCLLVRVRAKREEPYSFEDELNLLTSRHSIQVKVWEQGTASKWKEIMYLGGSGVQTVLVVAHLVFAIGLLSGTGFIGTQDALILTLQFFASVLGVRVLLRYELGRLRERVVRRDEGDITSSVIPSGGSAGPKDTEMQCLVPR